MAERRFRVAGVDVDTAANRLTCGPRCQTLEPRAMQLLQLLLVRRGEVVSRREIFDQVWLSAQVTDDALNRTVFDLRKAFRTLQPGLEPIETIRRVGYRLVDLPEDPGTDASRRRTTLALVAGLALLIPSLLLLTTQFSPQETLEIQPFSTEQGLDTYPSFFPDGRRVLFTCSRHGNQRPSLCVQDLDDATSSVLLPAGGEGAAIHPDGQRIAYQVVEGSRCEIRTFHPQDRSDSLLTLCNRRNDGSLAWSADGRHLFYSDARHADLGPFEIRSVPADGGPVSTVTRPPMHSVGDLFPAPAPDGRALAFFRADRESSVSTYVTPGIGRVHITPISDGHLDDTQPLRALTTEPAEVTGLAWVGAGSAAELVFFSNASGYSYALWRLPGHHAAPTVYRGFSGIVRQPAVAPDGALIAEQWFADADIYSHPLTGGTAPAQGPVFSSNRYDFAPAASPDGRHLTWISSRTGRSLLWIGLLDESRAMDFVELPADASAESPQWSPDSRRIAFEVRRQGRSQIAVYSLETNATQWLDVPGDNRVPSWSLDGRSLLFSSDRSGRWEVWRYRLGDGDAEQLTSDGAYAQREYRTETDTGLIFSRRNEPGLWKQSFVSGSVQRIQEALAPEFWGNWTVFDDQLYFALNDGGDGQVVAVDIDSGVAQNTLTLGRPVLRESTNLSIAPDGATLYYASRSQIRADLIRVHIDP